MITANTNRAQKNSSVPLHFHKINSANQIHKEHLTFNQGVKTLGQPTP